MRPPSGTKAKVGAFGCPIASHVPLSKPRNRILQTSNRGGLPSSALILKESTWTLGPLILVHCSTKQSNPKRMKITDPLILPKDLLITSVRELHPQVRKQFEASDDDFVLTRPRSRTPSSMVDSNAAALLKEFRTASTIVDAIIRFSQSRKSDPNAMLEEAYPLLLKLITSRFLVYANSRDQSKIEPTLSVGCEVDGWQITACIQALEDTEVYQVRSSHIPTAVLKISTARDDAAFAHCMIQRETEVLKLLDDVYNLNLLASGAKGNARYLVLEWSPGIPPTTVSRQICLSYEDPFVIGSLKAAWF